MMKKIYTLAIVLLVLGVSSCKLGKHYSRPELRLPEQIEGTVPDSVSAGDIRWTDLYTDPVLRQLIRKTLEGNKDLMIAAAKVKESMELRRIAKADLFPKAEATVSAEREYDETPGNTFEGKVLASWEVDLWGKLRWAGQAALAEYLQSVEGRQALQSALVAQVAQAYFELIALDQELAIVRQTLAARQEGVRLAKLRFEGGLTSENPLRQAQVELARTQTLVPGLEREIRLKENQITLLAGEYPGEVARGKSIGQQQLMTALPVGLSSQILERRPDIRQAERLLVAQLARKKSAQADLWPKLYLTGSIGTEAGNWGSLFGGPAKLYSFMPQISWPIFHAGAIRSNIKAQGAIAEQLLASYEQTVLSAVGEVRDSLSANVKEYERSESLRRGVEAAQAALDVANDKYANGLVDFTNVINAQRSLTSLSEEYVISQGQISANAVALFKALGGGWQPMEEAERALAEAAKKAKK